MPIDYEDFVRCVCGSPDFKEERILTLPKTLKPRESVKVPLQVPDVEYHILCAKCGIRIHV